MGQININVTSEFEAALARLMRVRGIRNKSEAIRTAVAEAAERATAAEPVEDFTSWIGLALGGARNPKPRFRTHDDLWR